MYHLDRIASRAECVRHEHYPGLEVLVLCVVHDSAAPDSLKFHVADDDAKDLVNKKINITAHQ